MGSVLIILLAQVIGSMIAGGWGLKKVTLCDDIET